MKVTDSRYQRFGAGIRAVMTKRAAWVPMACLLAACQPQTVRIVDCAPGYHNVSGPDSDCVPDTTTSSSSPSK